MSHGRMVDGVLGLAINAEGKYLLTLRNEPKNPATHRKWQVPGGGVEYGETAIDTLAREMKEELTITDLTVLFPYPIFYRALFEAEKVQVNLLCYVIDIGTQTPKIGDIETLEFGWFSVEEVGNLDTLGGTAEFVAEAEKIRTKYSLASE